MSTANFHSNINPVFVIQDWEKWETVDNIRTAFINTATQKVKEKKLERDIIVSKEESSPDDELRSYPASRIGSLTASLEYYGLFIEITLYAVIRAGYYVAQNLDIEEDPEVYWYNEEHSSTLPLTQFLKDIQEYPEDFVTDKKVLGLFKHHLSSLNEKINQQIDLIVNVIKESFGELADVQLVKVTQFSNGEAIYQKIDV